MSNHTEDVDQPPQVCVKTYRGIYFDLLDPKAKDVRLADIAHALSLVNRFGGHTPNAYSVAEHSLIVSAQIERRTGRKDLAAAGLFHDAAEAYIGDMNGLLKASHVGEAFRKVEQRLSREIEIRFLFPEGIFENPVVKAADKEAFDWECAFVRDSKVRVAPDPATVASEFSLRAFRLLGDVVWDA